MSNSLWGLLTVFLPISIVTVGGGQSAVAEIHRQVVDVHHWMTQADFRQRLRHLADDPGAGLSDGDADRLAGRGISGARSSRRSPCSVPPPS